MIKITFHSLKEMAEYISAETFSKMIMDNKFSFLEMADETIDIRDYPMTKEAAREMYLKGMANSKSANNTWEDI